MHHLAHGALISHHARQIIRESTCAAARVLVWPVPAAGSQHGQNNRRRLTAVKFNSIRPRFDLGKIEKIIDHREQVTA